MLVKKTSATKEKVGSSGKLNFLTDKMRFVIRAAIKKRMADGTGHEPTVKLVDSVMYNTVTEIKRTEGCEGMSLKTALVALKIALGESN